MHFAAGSRCALTKFSYSSFGVRFSSFLVVFRICFLILIRIYLLYLCCSIGSSHSVWWSLFVWRFFCRLNRIFAVTIQWSVDTPSKEEYASQFIALFFHSLCLNTKLPKKGGKTMDIHRKNRTTKSRKNQEIMFYKQPRIHASTWEAQNYLEFWDTKRSPNVGQRTRPCDSPS